MSFRLCCPLALCLAGFLVAMPACGGEPTADTTSAAKSVTVFPIVLNSGAPIPGVAADISKNMAQLVGLLLERGGMKEIEIADTRFVPSETADLAKIADLFGQFARSQKLKTEYALYGQFLGTPGKGADEIRLVVVDRHGKVVLTNRLDRQELSRKLASSGEKVVCPMLACCFTVDELRGLWGLTGATGEAAPQGKMAKLWTEKAGSPSTAEQKAMQARTNRLKQAIRTSRVAVFVRVSGSGDAKAADSLAKLLAHEALGQAQPAGEELTLRIEPSTNQVKILWDTAKAFQQFLRKNPPAADYALLADYGIGRLPDGKPVVGGVGLIVCDRKGDWVVVTGRNSHQSDFQQIDPRSPDDCNRLVVDVLKSHLH